MDDREEHAMVPVEWKGIARLIDAGIAPLIQELWDAELFTLNSCEENRPGWMWIQFIDVSSAEQFLNIVARYEEEIDSLYNRIRGCWSPDDGELIGEWEYDVRLRDLAVKETEVEDGYVEESCNGPSQFNFSLSVRFPRSDYPVLLERMREYNDTMEKAVLADMVGDPTDSELDGEPLYCDL